MSRVEGNTRRRQLLVLTPVWLFGAQTSTLPRCQKHLKKRWMTTVSSGRLKQRGVTRNQSFLLTGNDIDLLQGMCTWRICHSGLPYPLQKGGQPPGFEPPIGGREEKQKGHIAGPEGSRTSKSREAGVDTLPGPRQRKMLCWTRACRNGLSRAWRGGHG